MVFPFFVGCDRSGTTLVRAIFDSHPEMAIPGESCFIVPMGLKRQRYEGRDGFATELFLSDLLRHPHFCRWYLPEDTVRQALTAPPPESYVEAVRRLFTLYAQLQGKTRYGDKTPGYVLHIPLLAQLFPEARFIHVIRDGRNAALSIQEDSIRSGTKYYRNIGACAIHWRERVEAGRKAEQQIGSDRYHEVRYEDLVEDPERTIRPLCEFVELKFHNKMLRYFERAEELAASFVDPSIQRNLALPPTKGLRDWRRQMSRGDMALFEALASDLLVDLECELSDGLGPGARLSAHPRVLMLQARRLARRAQVRLRRWKKVPLKLSRIPHFALKKPPQEKPIIPM